MSPEPELTRIAELLDRLDPTPAGCCDADCAHLVGSAAVTATLATAA